MIRKSLLGLSLVLVTTGASFAAHPLITDDTGTQGKGNVQMEFIGEYGYDKEDGVTTRTVEFPTVPVLSYGMTDTVDLVLGLPYQYVRTKIDATDTDPGSRTSVKGIGDAVLEVKWRFYDRDGLSLALKPGITLPAGDEDRGLGAGRMSAGAVLITTKAAGDWKFHLNLSYSYSDYARQEDRDANRRGIWHASAATEYELIKGLRAVGNIGVERNPDKTSNTHPAFVLGGFIWSVTERLDVDAGIKGGLNKPETDRSLLAGVTVRF